MKFKKQKKIYMIKMMLKNLYMYKYFKQEYSIKNLKQCFT